MENPTNTAKLPSAASAAAASRPQRWSARRKQEIVLRLLRGEPIEAIARELGKRVFQARLSNVAAKKA
jgi:transposase-like protein